MDGMKDPKRVHQANALLQAIFPQLGKSRIGLVAIGADLLKFLLESPADPVRRQFLEFAVAILQAGIEAESFASQINTLPACCDPKWVHAAGIALGSHKNDISN